jgi:hypothetical protein
MMQRTSPGWEREADRLLTEGYTAILARPGSSRELAKIVEDTRVRNLRAFMNGWAKFQPTGLTMSARPVPTGPAPGQAGPVATDRFFDAPGVFPAPTATTTTFLSPHLNAPGHSVTASISVSYSNGVAAQLPGTHPSYSLAPLLAGSPGASFSSPTVSIRQDLLMALIGTSPFPIGSTPSDLSIRTLHTPDVQAPGPTEAAEPPVSPGRDAANSPTAHVPATTTPLPIAKRIVNMDLAALRDVLTDALYLPGVRELFELALAAAFAWPEPANCPTIPLSLFPNIRLLTPRERVGIAELVVRAVDGARLLKLPLPFTPIPEWEEWATRFRGEFSVRAIPFCDVQKAAQPLRRFLQGALGRRLQLTGDINSPDLTTPLFADRPGDGPDAPLCVSSDEEEEPTVPAAGGRQRDRRWENTNAVVRAALPADEDEPAGTRDNLDIEQDEFEDDPVANARCTAEIYLGFDRLSPDGCTAQLRELHGLSAADRAARGLGPVGPSRRYVVHRLGGGRYAAVTVVRRAGARGPSLCFSTQDPALGSWSVSCRRCPKFCDALRLATSPAELARCAAELHTEKAVRRAELAAARFNVELPSAPLRPHKPGSKIAATDTDRVVQLDTSVSDTAINVAGAPDGNTPGRRFNPALGRTEIHPNLLLIRQAHAEMYQRQFRENLQRRDEQFVNELMQADRRRQEAERTDAQRIEAERAALTAARQMILIRNEEDADDPPLSMNPYRR